MFVILGAKLSRWRRSLSPSASWLFVRLTASSSKSADKAVALQVADRLLEEYAGATPSVWKEPSSQVDLQTHARKCRTIAGASPGFGCAVISPSTFESNFRLKYNYWKVPDLRLHNGFLRNQT